MDYSEKEIKLLLFFGLEKLLDERDGFITPPTLYRMAVEKAFIDNLQGPEVESLRRCYKALIKSEIYRGTFEWDNLIQF